MDKDPFAEAQAGVELDDEAQCAQAIYGAGTRADPGRDQPPHRLPLYSPYPAQLTPEAKMRQECLYMALRAPDGAQMPPLDEVLKRARAYWRFIQTGE